MFFLPPGALWSLLAGARPGRSLPHLFREGAGEGAPSGVGLSTSQVEFLYTHCPGGRGPPPPLHPSHPLRAAARLTLALHSPRASQLRLPSPNWLGLYAATHAVPCAKDVLSRLFTWLPPPLSLKPWYHLCQEPFPEWASWSLLWAPRLPLRSPGLACAMLAAFRDPECLADRTVWLTAVAAVPSCALTQRSIRERGDRTNKLSNKKEPRLPSQLRLIWAIVSQFLSRQLSIDDR